jgi:hypothetical protein
MIRRITATALATCPVSVALGYAQAFLRFAEAGGAEATMIAGPLRRRVRMSFGLSTDHDPAHQTHEETRIRWSARTAWLPDFSGTLQFQIASVETTTLILDGTYTPPGGIAGFAFDTFVGQLIAQATAHDYVERIARDLERREVDWQKRFDSRGVQIAER